MSETVIRMGGYQGAKSIHTRAARLLGDELAKLTDGAAKLELTEDVTAAGRNATDLFPMVEGNELDICYFASSYLASRVPDLAAFDLPFTVTDRDGIYGSLDGSLGELLAMRIASATGFQLVGLWDNGFRHFTNAVRPLVAPDDCRGLSIRTMNNAVHQASFAAFGFQPVYIDVKDYPEAVRTRKVDAQENPLTNTVNFRVHETHRFATLSGHFYGLTLVLANRKRLQQWPRTVREALGAAMRTATEAQRGFAAAEDGDCRAVLEAAGVEVIDADGFDRAAFEAAAAPVVRREAAAIDPRVLRLVRG